MPRSVEIPPEVSGLGAHYDTEWARRPLASAVRTVITEGPIRLAARIVTDPEIRGTDRLVDLTGLEDTPPVIFAPNHHSHLDTGLMIRSVPTVWRRKMVVAAAADYFFDKRWKASISALALNAIPIDRELTGRKSSDLIRELIEDGYSLVIYPEGGRSPDGWGQSFKGGAAYLSARTGAAVVPVFIDGTGVIFGKGMKRPRPGRTTVVFGSPLRASPTRARVGSGPASSRPSRFSGTRRSPTSGPPADAPPTEPAPHCPAPSTRVGAVSGRSPSAAASGMPASAVASNAPGPTSADMSRGVRHFVTCLATTCHDMSRSA